jgi:hypothetical protein
MSRITVPRWTAKPHADLKIGTTLLSTPTHGAGEYRLLSEEGRTRLVKSANADREPRTGTTLIGATHMFGMADRSAAGLLSDARALQTGFTAFVFGAGLAIVLALLLKETGPAVRPLARQ